MRWGSFLEYLEQHPAPRAVLWIALAGVLCAVGAYTIAALRRAFREGTPDASELITNFRDLHGRGELSDEEYRTIKATLAERLRRQLDRAPVERPQFARPEADGPQVDGPQFEDAEPKLESFQQDTDGDD